MKKRFKVISLLLLSILLLLGFLCIFKTKETRVIKEKTNGARVIEALDQYKNKGEITIYDIEELLKVSTSSKGETKKNDEAESVFLEMLYTILSNDEPND